MAPCLLHPDLLNSSKKRLGSVAATALLVIGSIVIAGGIAEAALRLMHYGEVGVVHLSAFTEYDPTLSWKNRPNVSTEVVGVEYKTLVQHGPKGLRGRDRTYEKPANVSRIVALGDSFADGFTVPLQDRVTEVLESELGPKYEAINLGVSGYSTDQELLMLEGEGMKYHPDVVVLFLFYNDIWMNGDRLLAGSQQKPLFDFGENGDLVLKNVPVPPPEAELEDRSKVYALVRTAIKSNSWLYSILSSATGHKAAAAVSLPMPAGAGGTANQFRVFETADTPELTRVWSITQALLRRMKQETEQRGRLIVFYVPTRIELSPKEWSDAHLPADAYSPGQVAEQVTRICKAENISLIDPTGGFKEAARQGSLYYKYDPHWNSAGHHFAAEILKEYIQNSSPH